MEKPYTFAGKVVQKYGKIKFNDHPEPEKFFNAMKDYYTILDGVPYKAIEDLEKYELNRDIIIQSIQKLLRICQAAKIDVIQEMNRLDEDPFDGLEEDLAVKKK